MTPRLLVTGFGPFPSMPRNPSAALARAVAASPRWRRLGLLAECRVLTTAYGALATELAPALAEKPDAVLMIGVAGRARRVRLEWRATSRRSRLFADNAGEVPTRQRGSSVRSAKVPVVPALRLLQERHVPCRLSRDAGRYLCNASYFQALARPAPTLFVHIPKAATARPARIPRRPAREAGQDRLTAALVDLGIRLLAHARRPRVERARALL